MKVFRELSRFERGLWMGSVMVVTAAFLLTGSPDVLTLAAALESPGCAPMIVCFAMFLLNDCYGFVNWRRMMRSQQ